MSKFLGKAGLDTVADILDLQKEVSITKVYNELKSHNVKYRKNTVKAVIDNIIRDFPPDWKHLMKQQNRRSKTDSLNFALKNTGHNKLLTTCNNKVIYNILIKQITNGNNCMVYSLPGNQYSIHLVQYKH